MKRLTAFLAVFLILTYMGTGCLAASGSGTDYGELMVEAAASGDAEAGRKAAEQRNARITALGLDEPLIDYDELVLVAQIIHTEAGSEWLSDEWRIAVGEVLLNRVASPEFPNTIAECVFQPYQYSGVSREYFAQLVPYRWCAEAAFRLLCGERVLDEPSVVFQSELVQGSSIYLEMEDPRGGTTFFCVSNHPELYVSEAPDTAQTAEPAAAVILTPLGSCQRTGFCGGILDRLRGG